jgi:hypothetical protein
LAILLHRLIEGADDLGLRIDGCGKYLIEDLEEFVGAGIDMIDDGERQIEAVGRVKDEADHDGKPLHAGKMGA